MKKLGLSWLNPLMGLASLFGLPQKARSMIASRRAPAFDPKKASQLGLYADRQPTDTIRQARVGEGTIGSDIALGKKGIFESGQELLGLKDIKEHRADVSANDILRLMGTSYTGKTQKYSPEQDIDLIRMSEPTLSKGKHGITDQEIRDVLQKKITKPTGIFAADGGRIDKALIGRSRDI